MAQASFELLGDDGRSHHNAWQEDVQSDVANRQLLRIAIAKDGGLVDERERHVIGVGKDLYAKRDSGKMRGKKLRLNNSSLVRGEVFRTQVEGGHGGVSTALFGYASCEVRGASLDEMVAYLMDIRSNFLVKHEWNFKGVASDKIIEVVNSHHFIYHYKTTPSPPFQARDFVSRMVWEKQSSDRYILGFHPTDHDDALPTPDVVRATSTRIFRITATRSNLIKVELVFTLDLAGSIPTYIVEHIAIPQSINAVQRVQKYFLQIKSSADLSEEDGTMLGYLLIDEVRVSGLDFALWKFFYRSTALRDLAASYPWFQAFLRRLIENKVRAGTNNSVAAPLESITEKDAKHIASLFAVLLLSNVTSDAALDEFIHSCDAMKQLDETSTVFRPLLNGIAKRLLEGAHWGQNSRIATGATVSILDMASDVYMVYQYSATGQTTAAISVLCILAVSTVVQMLIVYLQNKRRGWGIIIREFILVFSCLKPAVDAYRVIRGGDVDPLLVLEPLQEVAFCKFAELGSEAVPAGVLQMSVLVTSSKMTPAALASILLSACSAGLTSATMSYDYDTSPTKRRDAPSMYGMVPDRGRGLVFFSMVVISMMQMMSKGLAVALLSLTNTTWIGIWFGAEYGLYLAYKMARKDIVFFVPGLTGAVKYTVAFLERIVVKLINDFSGVMLHRNPYEMGGVAFSLNAILSQAGCWVAAWLFISYYTGPKNLAGTTIYTALGVLFVTWVIGITLFFCKIKRAYWSTFYSTRTGSQQCMSYFIENEDDATRSITLRNHTDLWKGIEPDVMDWTLKNWRRWEREMPAWFTENWKEKVPDKMIPKAALDELNARAGGERRRSSFFKNNPPPAGLSENVLHR